MLLASIGFNYLISKQPAKNPNKSLLALEVTGNIMFLDYFKYAWFVKTTLGAAIGMDFWMVSMVLF